MQVRTAGPWLLVAAALLTVGCASRGATDGPIENVQIAVDQTGSVAGSLRIWLVPESGARRLAGTTDGSGVDTLTVRQTIPPGMFRLVAEPSIGSSLVSTPFAIDYGGIVVDWNLVSNSVFARPVR